MNGLIQELRHLLGEAKAGKFKPGTKVKFVTNPASILFYAGSLPKQGATGKVVAAPASTPDHVKKNFVFVDFGDGEVKQLSSRDLEATK